MAHNTNRRNLATLEHKPKTSISMDPTLKKQPKPTPFTPTPNNPSNTIDNISNQFSQLYAKHKILKSSTKDSCGVSYSSLDSHLIVKSWTDSAVFNSSCTALTKSKSQHGSSTMVFKERKFVKDSYKEHDIDKAIVVYETEGIKKVSQKGKEFHKELAKGQESERLKGYDEIKKQSLLLPLVKGERRKSFSSSQVELGDFFSCAGVKVVSVDMPPFMQIHAVNCARKTRDSLEKFTSKALALTLKKEFDGVYGPAWHCIVGTSFGSFVTHSTGGFIYFSMDHKLYVLLFKTTVQKAESN